jgi:hypothetical protein
MLMLYGRAHSPVLSRAAGEMVLPNRVPSLEPQAGHRRKAVVGVVAADAARRELVVVSSARTFLQRESS